VISGAQLRAARGLLGMTSREFAGLANVSWATVKRFELCDGVPQSRAGTLERVASALEAAGIEFIGDPVTSPGVRLRSDRAKS
jgi:DNA-binding transcriptional regulator YiaG